VWGKVWADQTPECDVTACSELLEPQPNFNNTTMQQNDNTTIQQHNNTTTQKKTKNNAIPNHTIQL
jgi:hypothetical protein